MQLSRRQLVSSLIAHAVLVILLSLAPTAWAGICQPFADWLCNQVGVEADDQWDSVESSPAFFHQY